MELSRLTQAAAALSSLLCSRGIRHAFYGSIFPALLAKNPVADVRGLQARLNVIILSDRDAQEIFCIVETGSNHAHPFRRVRDACAGLDDFSVTHSPMTNR